MIEVSMDTRFAYDALRQSLIVIIWKMRTKKHLTCQAHDHFPSRLPVLAQQVQHVSCTRNLPTRKNQRRETDLSLVRR